MRLPLTQLVGVALLAIPALPLVAHATAPDAVGVTAVVRDASGHLTFRHRRSSDPAGLVGDLRRQSDVVAASVDHRVQVLDLPAVPIAPVLSVLPVRTTVNALPRNREWGLDVLHADQVGRANGQVVAVVDTGVDASHPDLAGVILPGTDFVTPGGDGRSDPNGHGTHVAGIVAAVSPTGLGVSGLAQGAQILPVRVMAADGSGWDSDAAKGVVWAADHGATVINLSFGSHSRSDVMDSAVSYALSQGVSVVVSAGNDGTSVPEWPAAEPGVIAVAAVDATGSRPVWSSTGPDLAVSAPGVDILSTVPRTVDPSGYASWSGTSMAAPFVSAAAALLKHAQPGLGAAAVRQRLMDTADDLGAPGYDTEYGAGRVDVVAAEAATVASTSVAQPPSAAATASRTSVPYAGAVTLTGRVLSAGVGTAGLAARLERQDGPSWTAVATGRTGAAGVVAWVVHPTRTAAFRVAGDGWTSPVVQIRVTPVLKLSVSPLGVTGRVLPAGATAVRLDVLRSTGWVALTTVRSGSDGAFRLSRVLRSGTVLRAVAGGAVSPSARV